VIAAEVAGVAIFGLPGGSLLAGMGAQRAMLLADGVRAPLVLAIPALHWAGALDFPVLLALVFAVGALAGPYFAAQRVVVPELLGEEQELVSRANALLQGANRITLILGPALGGLLITVVGAANVLVLDAATYALSFLLVAVFIPRTQRVAEDERSRGLTAGFRYLARDPLLRTWGGMMILVDASWVVLFAGVPVLVFEQLGARAATAGWIIAAFGVGAILGNAVSYRFLRRVDSLLWASLGLLVESLPLWLLPLPIPAWAVAAAMLLAGVVNGLVNPALHSLFTLRPPAAVRAKVMTATLTLSQVGSPLALLAAGPAFAAFGARPVFAAVALTQTCARVVAASAGLRVRRQEQPLPAMR
jgi:predicted MFS family arabinose efflux permease